MKDAVKTRSVSKNEETIWNKEFISIFMMNILLYMGQFMMNALLPKYAEHLGATASVIGLVSGMFAVTALCIRPIVGPATSYFRKNILLAVTSGFIFLSFILYGFASSIPMIIAGRLLHGIGMGFLAPTTLALASDALPNSKMASGIGIYSLGQGVATAIGPTVGLELAKVFGYNNTFFLTSALIGVVLVMTLCLKTEKPDRTGGFKISMNNIIAVEVITPAIIMFLISGTYSCISSFIVIYGGICGVEKIGHFFTAYAACLLFIRPFSGKIADKYGMDKTIIPAIIAYAVSFIVISFSRSLPMFILSGVILAFGYGICLPSIQTLCMRLVSKERRGVAGNTSYIGVDAGYLITPILAGFVVTTVQKYSGSTVLGYAVMYRLMVVPILIALIIFLWKRKELIQ